ncbi:MAG: hypothetical protein GEU98_28075 [Pseudonocardiaceae bacterium]|nr:hypothetical protein [Pseudonocardiaceae bacterium]
MRKERHVAERQQLPLPDYDELPLASLRHQIRALDSGQLHALLEHERAHADRTPVEEMLTARLDQLADGATPSGGDQQAGSARPESTPAGSPVSPASAAQPTGPLRNARPEQTPGRDRP